MIHTFGDSHASNKHSLWHDIPEIQCHHIGPVLCYTKQSLKDYEIKPGDTVIFCFGEIVCRCYVHKYPPYQQHIDTFVNNYLTAVKTNTDINIIIYNVPPVIARATVSREYPFLGTDEERKTYAEYFNTRLKEGCLERGFVFLDVYDCYAGIDGFMIPEYGDGHVHCTDGRFVKEFLDNLKPF